MRLLLFLGWLASAAFALILMLYLTRRMIRRFSWLNMPILFLELLTVALLSLVVRAGSRTGTAGSWAAASLLFAVWVTGSLRRSRELITKLRPQFEHEEDLSGYLRWISFGSAILGGISGTFVAISFLRDILSSADARTELFLIAAGFASVVFVPLFSLAIALISLRHPRYVARIAGFLAPAFLLLEPQAGLIPAGFFLVCVFISLVARRMIQGPSVKTGQ